MDSSDALHYNAGTVVSRNANELEQERFRSEIMTHLDHLYRVAFYLVKSEVEAFRKRQEEALKHVMIP